MVMLMLSASGRQDCSEKHDRQIKGEKQGQRTLKSIALEESVATNNRLRAI